MPCLERINTFATFSGRKPYKSWNRTHGSYWQGKGFEISCLCDKFGVRDLSSEIARDSLCWDQHAFRWRNFSLSRHAAFWFSFETWIHAHFTYICDMWHVPQKLLRNRVLFFCLVAVGSASLLTLLLLQCWCSGGFSRTRLLASRHDIAILIHTVLHTYTKQVFLPEQQDCDEAVWADSQIAQTKKNMLWWLRLVFNPFVARFYFNWRRGFSEVGMTNLTPTHFVC